MKEFIYKARDKQGHLVSGHIEADSEEAVVTKVIRSGLTPIIVEEGKGLSFEEQFNYTFKIGQPTTQELISFSHQMATLLGAGVPIIKSLKVVSQSIKNSVLISAIQDIALELESGQSLSKTFLRHPNIFPKIFSSMAVVGEATGSLDNSFSQVCTYLESEKKLTNRISSATRYPSFVFITVFIALIIVNIMVIPAFEGFFNSMEGELPLVTKVLLSASSFFQNYITHMMAAILSLLMFFVYWKQTPSGDFHRSKLKIALPIVGPLIHQALVARICRSFSLMLNAGVPVLQALIVVAKPVDNIYMVEKIMQMKTSLERGSSLPEAASRVGIFTDLVMQMLIIGEETGELGSMLEKIAKQYEEEVDYELKRISEIIEPLMIAIVSMIVVILALGIFMPMWEMSAITMRNT